MLKKIDWIKFEEESEPDDEEEQEVRETIHNLAINSMQFHMEEASCLVDIEIISIGDICDSIIFIA